MTTWLLWTLIAVNCWLTLCLATLVVWLSALIARNYAALRDLDARQRRWCDLDKVTPTYDPPAFMRRSGLHPR